MRSQQSLSGSEIWLMKRKRDNKQIICALKRLYVPSSQEDPTRIKRTKFKEDLKSIVNTTLTITVGIL